MTRVSDNSPMDPGISRLLDVFGSDLAGVSFPDVDGATLTELATAFTQHQQHLAAVRAELAAAEQALSAARTTLLDRAREALAYARLYAQRHPALAEKLDGVQLGAPLKRPRKPRKPRTAEPRAVPLRRPLEIVS